MAHTLKTTLTLDVGEGSITELVLVVSYTATAGRAPSWSDPGSPDEIEITKLRLLDPKSLIERPIPGWLDNLIRNDEALHTSLVIDWREQQEAAREYAAEAKREERMLGGRS